MEKKISFKGSILVVMVATALSACGSAQQKSEKSGETAGESTQGKAPAFENEKMADVYKRYIHLKDALVASDASESAAAAGALNAALQEIPEAGEARQAAGSVAEAADIAARRQAFATLSNAIADLVKNSGITSGEVYLAFCPMADDNAGAYWLASEKEIRNPYFGEKMMTCGEVKETIK